MTDEVSNTVTSSAPSQAPGGTSYADLKAVYFNGTLKKSPETSRA